MSHLAEQHSAWCEQGFNPNGGDLECGIATCPNFMYKDDLDIIINEWKLASIDLTKEQADELWGLYSESVCAGWIGIKHDRDEPNKRYSWIRDATREFLGQVLDKES